MHAVLIPFQSTADLETLTGPFSDRSHGVSWVSGLVTKTWIQDGTTLVCNGDRLEVPLGAPRG